MTESRETDPRRVPPLMTAAWETTTTAADPLEALGAARALAGLLATWETQLVGEAVAAGVTWEAIGGTVGVSRQAAWQRFHGDLHEFRDRVKSEMNDLRSRHHQELVDLKETIRHEARKIRHGGT